MRWDGKGRRQEERIVMNKRLLFALVLGAICALGWGQVSANDIYYVDPIVARNLRVVDAPLLRKGGRVDIPASDGVSAELSYPTNDACAGSTMHIAGLGPAGIDHYDMDSVSVYRRGEAGWAPFYLLTIMLREPCAHQTLRFSGFPRLSLSIPNAHTGTVYYMDVNVESGNSTHIPVGPPDERDSKNVVFDFAMLPSWAHDDGYLNVPLAPTIRLIVARQ